MSLFGRKTVGGGKLFTIFFRAVSFFAVFYRHKPLPFSDKRRAEPPQKNHTKNTTVGFWCFGCYARIFIVKVEKYTEHIEGELVASLPLDGSPHRLIHALRVIRGSLQKRDHGLHRFRGFAARAGPSNLGRPNAFLKLRALRVLRGETKLSSRKLLIFKIGFMQVVDFHDRFGKFRVVADISNAFLEMRKTRLAGKKGKRVGWMFVCNSTVGQSNHSRQRFVFDFGG